MAAVDNYDRFQVQLDDPGSNAAVVTPGTADLGYVTRGLYITEAGTVTTVMQGGGTVTWGEVPAGVLLPIRVTKVTAAAGAVAIW